MIYSCTMFLNEVSLLRLKVNEEIRGGVEQFIVVESRYTFSGKSKLPMLATAYLPSQVRVVQLDEEMMQVPEHPMPTVQAFQREAIQRNAALKDVMLQDDDVVISSDMDEIFPAEDIPAIVAAAKEHGFVHLEQDTFHYKINLWVNHIWYAPFAATGAYLKGKTLNQLRNTRTKRIPTNGKHFGYAMSPEAIAYKIQSFSHVNLNTQEFTDPEAIAKKIEQWSDLFNTGSFTETGDVVQKKMVPVVLDETYPKLMLMEIESWRPWILDAKVRLSEVKKYFPITKDLTDEEFESRFRSFYDTIDNVEITFPWRAL